MSRTSSVAGHKTDASRAKQGVGSACQTVGIPVLIALGAVTLALIWSFWPVIEDLMREWRRNSDYSAGQLVPLVALYLLWVDRQELRECRVQPCWWGIFVILLALTGRAFGQLFIFESAERYSLVLTIAGLVLLIAGVGVFRRTGWILLFLFLMVPFPGRVHNLISGPLQTQATISAVFLIELIGITVVREGNVILLNGDIPLAVAEACSGLRMLTAFVIVTATMAYIVNRSPWQKVILLASSVPVAIFCNLVRLVVTAVLFLVASSEIGEKFFHDFAGLIMMPLAIVILLGELWIMGKLVVTDTGSVTTKGRKLVA